MKSKVAGCGSISTVISSIVLLSVSSIIIIIIIIMQEKAMTDISKGFDSPQNQNLMGKTK